RDSSTSLGMTRAVGIIGKCPPPCHVERSRDISCYSPATLRGVIILGCANDGIALVFAAQCPRIVRDVSASLDMTGATNRTRWRASPDYPLRTPKAFASRQADATTPRVE